MKKSATRTLVFAGVLVAIHIVLSRFCSINAWNLKIGLAFVPVAVAAMLFGPLIAAAVGGVGDLLGAILFPIGPYFPGFTLTAVLIGLVYGLMFYRKQSVWRVICAVVATQLGGSLLLNTLWISILYHSPFLPLMVTRLGQCAIMIPVECVVICLIAKAMSVYKKKVTP